MLRCLLLLSASLLLLSACRIERLGAGKGRWRVVETEHFTLYTDLREEDAEKQARELERLLSALQQSSWEANQPLPLRLNVVMFKRLLEFERYSKSEVGGFVVHSVMFEPWLVMPAPEVHAGFKVAAHELTHYIAHQALVNQPRWFSEGLASYFESVRFVGEGALVIGGVPKQRFDALRFLGVDKPSELLAGAHSTSEPRFYGSAWLLVHYLMTEHPDAFVAYQKALARGLDDTTAWSTAFPSLPPQELDRAVSEYLLTGEYVTFEVPVQLPSAQVRTRTLTPADEHALQAILWDVCLTCSETERARVDYHLARALEADPRHLQAAALSISNTSDTHENLKRVRALVKDHPDHWLAWITFARVTGEAQVTLPPQELEQMLERLLTLAPKQAWAWAFAGVHHALRGAVDQARDAFLRAQRLQPTDPFLLWLCGVSFTKLGECGRAERILTRLETPLHGGVNEQHLEMLRTEVAACATRDHLTRGAPAAAP